MNVSPSSLMCGWLNGSRVRSRTISGPLRAVATMPRDQWPADGDAGYCPHCNGSVRYMTANGDYGVWFHDDGREDCDA